MSTLDNRSVLAKADFALQHLVDNGGLLLPKQAKKFMRLSTTEAVLCSTRSDEMNVEIPLWCRLL